MADTLLFRGGSTADIELNSTNVNDREIVIDTDTDTIVLGSSKRRTVMNGSPEDVGIGTYNPQGRLDVRSTVADPVTGDTKNIVLYNQAGGGGGASVLSNASLVLGADFLNNSNQGRSLIAFETDGDRKMILNASGDLLIGGTLPSTPNIELEENGKATFARDVEITTAADGVILASPNGTRYRITVADDGTLTTTAV